MRHTSFFLGVQNGVFWVGAKKITVGTINYSRSGKTFAGINFREITDFIAGWPRLELIMVSGNFQALLFLQDKLLESV